MEYRVEELAAAAGLSVDTVRYYQARDLLPAPIRVGRVAWYRAEHLDRLVSIRRLQGRGLSLAVIRRLLDGELDPADEDLAAAVAGRSDESAISAWLTLEELADSSGIPLPLLQAVAREGLLVPRQVGGQPRYTESDVEVARAGLRLLEHGLPLPELLALARQHDAAMRAVAERAVTLFDDHIRQPLQAAGLADDEIAARLVSAFDDLLPATLAIVAHHFSRTLLAVAQDHIEHVGSDGEKRVVAAKASQQLEDASWAG